MQITSVGRKLLFVWLALTIVGGTLLGEDVSPGNQPTKRKLSPQELKQRRLRGKALKYVTRQLNRAKILGKGGNRKGLDDLFLVGTSQITVRNRDAEVRFSVMNGADKSSNTIADYLLATPKGVARDFRVFARFKNEQDAQKGLIEIRQRYDQVQAYRAALMKLYNARSMRRC